VGIFQPNNWTISAKRKEKCPKCKGAGYLPVTGDTGSPLITVETECKRCRGNKEITMHYNLSIESLKDLLK
tara:strand:- start:584 stop:796 length:213 start_codon:yes stop_codon:yes gene_type:complete